MNRLKREVDTAQIKDVSYFSMFSSVLILSNWVKEDIEFILSNNNKADKTWSSVSNSSLSKTFALDSLQNLKFRPRFHLSKDHFHLSLFWVKKNF